jgi:hypothetical protein
VKTEVFPYGIRHGWSLSSLDSDRILVLIFEGAKEPRTLTLTALTER